MPSSEVNQYELASRLLSLTENTSYTLTQINGQRIYRKAPHAWVGPEPIRKCEVFIGRIPHDCFEDTLVPLFQQAGELFEFRLMINFSGWNRGYAFAMYTTPAAASNAICMFNNYLIRPSWQLGVCPSVNNCRIFISRIPSTTSSIEIVRLLYALTEEVHEVRIRRSGGGCAAIVEYKSHRGAAMARKALVAAASAAWGSGARPAVDWSLPQSPHLLRQYREVGRWTPERGVEIYQLRDELVPAATASYTLERWSQTRRLLMIYEAQRARSAPNLAPVADPIPAPEKSIQIPLQDEACGPDISQNYGLINNWSHSLGNVTSNMGSLNINGTYNSWKDGGATENKTLDYNPWTTQHPLRDPRDKKPQE
ncbi:probable RNA-binding protein 46 [Pieris napi]|uniref:probable RNA-binding protein 46 n=1 Tax=Pieris napi TaxID=78633 RepID=UPI001FB9A312|nr:probable RNA-binding protein 46 [Pieris napi]